MKKKVDHRFFGICFFRHAGPDKLAPAGSKPGASRALEASTTLDSGWSLPRIKGGAGMTTLLHVNQGESMPVCQGEGNEEETNPRA